MIKEKFEMIKRNGKKMVAGILAATMTIEQVPSDLGGGISLAKAAETRDAVKIPELFGYIKPKDTVNSLTGAITLSRKTSEEATITIDSSDTSYTINQPAVHIDTPVIYYDPHTEEYFAKIVGLTSDGNPIGPEEYAAQNELEVAGGVAVNIKSFNSSEWTMWTPISTNNSRMADDEDENVLDEAEISLETETSLDENQETEESQISDDSLSATEESTQEKAEAAAKEDLVLAAETTDYVEERNAETEFSSEETASIESIVGDEQEKTTASSELDQSKETEINETEKQETESVEETKNEAGKETDSSEIEQEETEETKTEETKTEETKTEEIKAEETKTEESATDRLKDTLSSDETKTETSVEETKAEEIKQVLSGDGIDTYAGSNVGDFSGYPYVFAPTDKQMFSLPKTAESDPQFYYGNVKLTAVADKYAPSTQKKLQVEFKFFVKDTTRYHIPEGLSANCYSWIDMKGFTDPDKIPHNATSLDNGGFFAGEERLRSTSVIKFLYSNIDWNVTLDTVKGTESDPVIPWQKNNYSSYILTIKNTSGILEDGTLDEVPDTTFFSDYDVEIDMPDQPTMDAYSAGWQFPRYYMEADGSIGEQESYYNTSSGNVDTSKTFLGKWIANDLSNVDYKAERYDESGGAVIVDVTDVSEADRLTIEDPQELVKKGGKLLGYRWNAGGKFTFRVRNEILYPPQFGVDSKGNQYVPGKYDPSKKTERVYRIYAPFTNSLKADTRGITVHRPVTTNTTIYFGGSTDTDMATPNNASYVPKSEVVDEGIPLIDDRPEEVRRSIFSDGKEETADETDQADASDAVDSDETLQDDTTSDSTDDGSDTDDSEDNENKWAVPEQPGTETEGLGHRWSKSDTSEVYLTIPDYQASGEKVVQEEKAYAGKKLIYTLEKVGIQEDEDGKVNTAVPMYRPNVVDTLPDNFELQEIQFVFPDDEKLINQYSKEGKTPADFWLGGIDPLLGKGIVGDPNKNAYPVLEYLEHGKEDTDDWQPVTSENGFVLIPEETAQINGQDGVIYSYDVKEFFENLGYYPKKIRINYRCCWVPLTKCMGNVRLVGVSKISGTLVNTAVTSFTILNYEVRTLDAEVAKGYLDDMLGYFNVTKSSYVYRETQPSVPSKHVEKSEISGKVYAETEIKGVYKINDTLQETPIVLDYGNYLIRMRNDSPAEGYNVDLKFTLN